MISNHSRSESIQATAKSKTAESHLRATNPGALEYKGHLVYAPYTYGEPRRGLDTQKQKDYMNMF